MQTVLAPFNVKPQDQLMFLGEPMGLQRYDNPKHPIFLDLYDRQWRFVWQPHTINMTADRGDFQRLNEVEQGIFNDNLRFQIMGDSMLSRSIGLLLEHCTNTALESCMAIWAAVETLHSRSYAYTLDSVYPSAADFYDSVLADEEIVARAKELRTAFDSLLPTGDTESDLRQRLFNAVLAAQIMEGVTFYVSFACSFYFDCRGVMTGNGNIIKYISRDENIHVAITSNILSRWRDCPEEGFQDVYQRNRDLVVEAYKVAVEQEKRWSQYLFRKGNLVGMTAASLSQFSMWMANNRLASNGFPKAFGDISNPFAWITPYFDSKAIQAAPQETEVTSYAQVDTGMASGSSVTRRGFDLRGRAKR